MRVNHQNDLKLFLEKTGNYFFFSFNNRTYGSTVAQIPPKQDNLTILKKSRETLNKNDKRFSEISFISFINQNI